MTLDAIAHSEPGAHTVAAKACRVVHCTSGNLFGGIETFLASLSKLREYAPELDQEFALTHEGKLADLLRAEGAELSIVGPTRFSRPWTVMATRRRFRELLAARRPDVVVCHAAWPHALFAPVARRAGLPLVFWMHDRLAGRAWSERLSSRTPPDLAIANSKNTAETVSTVFADAEITTLPYPVSPSPPFDRQTVRARLRRELSTPEDAVVIVQVCRLERWKGHAFLIDALGLLRERPNWIAWIAGGVQRPHEEVYLNELRAQAATLGIADRVRFVGQRSDVPMLLASADLHCQPNTGPEPFGIVFVEALLAGLPLVSTRMGGAAEIIDDTCGILTPPGDVAALAKALAALIDDPRTRARLGAAAPARGRELCDPSVVLARLQDLLTTLARKPRR